MADVSITGAGAHASAEATMRIPAITAAGVKGYLTPALIATYLEARTELAELIRDVIATALTAGSNITVTPDDGADTITIASSAAGVSDGDKGDVAVSGSGATWTVESYNGGTAFGALAALNTVGTTQIDNSAVTLAKMANLNQYELIGRTSAGAGAPEAIATSANVASLLQAANYAAIRGLLDLEPGTDFYSISAADSAISTAVSNHAAAADPHTVYALESALGALASLNTVGTTQIDDDAVTFAKLLNATAAGFIGATGAGAFSERTPTQVTAALDAMVGDSGAGGTKGLVPAPAAGDAAASKFLKADGTWAAPSGGSVEDDAYGSGWNGDTANAPSQNAVYDKIEGLLHPGYVSANYVHVNGDSLGNISNGSTLAANTIYYWPFMLGRSVTLSSLGAYVRTASAGGNFKVAVYASHATTKLPSGTPVAETGDISTTSLTEVVADITGADKTLNANTLYWAAIRADNTTVTFQGDGLSGKMAHYVGSSTLGDLQNTNSGLSGVSSSETYANAWPDGDSETFTIWQGSAWSFALIGLVA